MARNDGLHWWTYNDYMFFIQDIADSHERKPVTFPLLKISYFH